MTLDTSVYATGMIHKGLQMELNLSDEFKCFRLIRAWDAQNILTVF